MKTWLPEIVKYEDFNNDWNKYENKLYEIFEKDLYKNPPKYLGKPVKTKYYPPFKKKAFTFWHITHEGENEDTRTPEFRRCERLCWIKPIIVHASEVKTWIKTEKKDRHYLWLDEEQYLIVLAPKRDSFLLITAFYVKHKTQVDKYNKEYQKYGKK